MNISDKIDNYRSPNPLSWKVWIFGTSVYYVISSNYTIMKICGTSIPINFSLKLTNGYKENLISLCLTLRLDIFETFIKCIKENKTCFYDRFFFTENQSYLKYKPLTSSYIYIEKDEFLFKALDRLVELRTANIYEKENLY